MALRDLLIVGVLFTATLFIARSAHSSLAGVYAVFVGVIASSWRLYASHSNWWDLGLRAPGSWLRTILLAIALLAASQLAVFLIVGPIARAAHWPAMDVSRFAGMHGNWQALLGWLLVAWTSAAIGEELLFRGFLLSQLQVLLGSTRIAAVAAIVAQAVCFGVAHGYLGPRGVATALVVGLLYGGVYVATGRNLLVLMLAHGLTDSLSLIAIYAGAVPSG